MALQRFSRDSRMGRLGRSSSMQCHSGLPKVPRHHTISLFKIHDRVARGEPGRLKATQEPMLLSGGGTRHDRARLPKTIWAEYMYRGNDQRFDAKRKYLSCLFVGTQGPRKNSISHIDASLSRQPLVKGERLVRYEVNAVMPAPRG